MRMPEAAAAQLLSDGETLRAWLVEQRWFASKARGVSELHVLEQVALREGPPTFLLAIVEAVFQPGTHEIYQLPLGLRPAEAGWSAGVIAEVRGWTVYDGLVDPEIGRCLYELMRGRHEAGELRFRWSIDDDVEVPTTVSPVGAEQSNSSVVFDESMILKVFRRLEAGVNPELELLRFLCGRGFEHVPSLAGWYEWGGRLMDSTLGVMQRYLAGATDGWELALDELGRSPETFLNPLRELGAVTGELHTALGSDAGDPAFAPEQPSAEALALLNATVDEQIERVFVELPDDERVEPVRGRGQDVRERLQALSQIAVGGRVIRTHGDFHLGQTMRTPDGWKIIDFEGEPARPLPERRQKRSPLRDVAGMLRSFAYVASASELMRGVPAPDGWEERARVAFLDGYHETVDSSLLPPGRDATDRLLSVFELEKAVYELRYELNNRPDWVPIPVAGILRLLEQA
jgi:maltokinase